MEEIFVPALGMAMEEAVLNEWLKAPGDDIAVGDVVAVVETDKSTYDLVASSAGVLGARRYDEGAAVPVGVTITVVLAPGDSEPDAVRPASAPPAEPDVVGSPDPADSVADASDGAGDAGVRQPHRQSPRRRRLAALAALADTVAAVAPAATPGAVPAAAHDVPAAAPAAPIGAPAVPMGSTTSTSPATVDGSARARAAVASAVSQSWATIPHFAVSRLIPADALRAAVSEASVPPARVTVTDALLRALALAVEDFDQDAPATIAMSVATDRGVVNVSVPGLHELRLRRIARVRRDVVTRARQGRLNVADTAPAAATLSNLGTHGVHWFTGIVPVGQGMLLTVGAIHDAAASDGGHVVLRPSFWATLNLDHRRYDGADGARLLEAFASVVGDTRVLVGD